jgi:hypothetical protein
MTEGPSIGSVMPIAIRLLPLQLLRQKSRTWCEIAEPGASARSKTRLGNARTPAL